MKAINRVILFFLVIQILCCSASTAYSEELKTYNMGGTISLEDGTPLAGIRIVFSLSSGKGDVPAPTYTDERGKWSQSGFADRSTYWVTPKKQEYIFTPYSLEVFVTSNFSNINFEATEKDPKPKQTYTPPVDQGQVQTYVEPTTPPEEVYVPITQPDRQENIVSDQAKDQNQKPTEIVATLTPIPTLTLTKTPTPSKKADVKGDTNVEPTEELAQEPTNEPVVPKELDNSSDSNQSNSSDAKGSDKKTGYYIKVLILVLAIAVAKLIAVFIIDVDAKILVTATTIFSQVVYIYIFDLIKNLNSNILFVIDMVLAGLILALFEFGVFRKLIYPVRFKRILILSALNIPLLFINVLVMILTK